MVSEALEGRSFILNSKDFKEGVTRLDFLLRRTTLAASREVASWKRDQMGGYEQRSRGEPLRACTWTAIGHIEEQAGQAMLRMSHRQRLGLSECG